MGQKITAEKVVVGVRGKVVGDATEDQRKFWTWGKKVYADLAIRCIEGLEKIVVRQDSETPTEDVADAYRRERVGARGALPGGTVDVPGCPDRS